MSTFKPKTILQVAELVAKPEWDKRPGRWFLTETVFTSDGPRTRICDGRWLTQEEAEAERDRRLLEQR